MTVNSKKRRQTATARRKIPTRQKAFRDSVPTMDDTPFLFLRRTFLKVCFHLYSTAPTSLFYGSHISMCMGHMSYLL